MTDPDSGVDASAAERRVKNPPRESRRRARAAAAAAPPETTKPAPAPAGGPSAAAKAAAAAEEEKKKRTTPRGMVCPECGKYHDVTRRPIGSTFDCKCGATLSVPPPPEGPSTTRPPEVTLKLLELRQRAMWSMLAMITAFVVCIALLSATLVLLVGERRWGHGTCAGVAALVFLILAVVAASEMRRCKAEIAAEQVGA